jgi:hypothetical protein
MHKKEPGGDDDVSVNAPSRVVSSEAEPPSCEHELSAGYRCQLRAGHLGLHYWRSDDNTRDFSWG